MSARLRRPPTRREMLEERLAIAKAELTTARSQIAWLEQVIDGLSKLIDILPSEEPS